MHEDHGVYDSLDIPFGCAKSPFSTPDLIALLNWVSKTASEDARFLWLALRYFLSEGRLRATIELARLSIKEDAWEKVNKAYPYRFPKPKELTCCHFFP